MRMRVHVRFANFFSAFCICKFCLILQIRPDIVAIKSSPASLHKIYETAWKDPKNYERKAARKNFAKTFFIIRGLASPRLKDIFCTNF